jgi:DNA-binding transcriptional regulator YhcF (GntR family)
MRAKKNQLEAGERMPSRNPNGLPAYQRIQSVIRKRIEGGQLHPGDPVPSERDLAKIHHVSLMTARHALASLEREGIVERRRGIGTFVAAPKIHFNKLMSYTEQMASRSLTAGSRVLFAKIMDNESEAAARLSLPPTSGILGACSMLPSGGNRFLGYWSAITRWSLGTLTKKWMLQPRTHGSPNSWRSRAENRCCAFARSFIPPKEKQSCMCWASTVPTGTTWSFAGSGDAK